MGALGWIGLAVHEDAGGAGLGLSEAVALAEEIGAGLAPEPLVPAMLSARLLAAGDDAALLASLLAGETVVLTAWQERADTLAVPGTPDAPRVFIPMAAGADTFLLPVREANRIALHALPAAGADVTLEKAMDGGNIGTLRADLSRATRVADDIGAVIEQALDEAALATAGLMLGLMERAFDDDAGLSAHAPAIRPHHRHLPVAAASRGGPEDAYRADARGGGIRGRGAGFRRDRRGAPGGGVQGQASRGGIRRCWCCANASSCMAASATPTNTMSGLYLRRGMVIMNQYGSATLHRRRFMALAPEDVE